MWPHQQPKSSVQRQHMPWGGAATWSRPDLRHSTSPPQNHNTPWRSVMGPLPLAYGLRPGPQILVGKYTVERGGMLSNLPRSPRIKHRNNVNIPPMCVSVCDNQPLVRRSENLELSLCIRRAYKTAGIGLVWMWLKALVKGPDLVKAPWKDSVVIWLFLGVCESARVNIQQPRLSSEKSETFNTDTVECSSHWDQRLI